MTRRPRLRVGAHLWRGLGAIALFAVMAAVFLTAEFGDPAGFGGIESITAGIGYALFDISPEAIGTGTEPFLVAFIVIAVVLDAALEGAVLLARREEGGQIVEALTTSGGGEE